MPTSAGRNLLMALGTGSPLTYATIASATSNDITFSDTEVDKTTMDDAGQRQLHAGAGVRSATMSIEGLFSDAAGQAALITAVGAGTHVALRLQDTTNSLSFTGIYQITSFTLTGAEGDMQKFSASFASAGAVTVTNT
jgi:TP901-1 family phage major tail protein